MGMNTLNTKWHQVIISIAGTQNTLLEQKINQIRGQECRQWETCA